MGDRGRGAEKARVYSEQADFQTFYLEDQKFAN